jgi:hypothetical protein
MAEAPSHPHAPALRSSGRTATGDGLLTRRLSVFFLQVCYLGFLVVIAILYFKGIWIHRQYLGTVPIAVPWWGAIGAVLLSLSAVFEHRDDWEPSIAPWYWARPIFGVFMASFGVLVFQAGVLAVGKDLKPAPGVTNSQNLFYYVLAFIVGYREETARTLIKRVGDAIIGAGESDASKQDPKTLPAISYAPATEAAGSSMTVTGSGLTGIRGVDFGGTATTFTVDSDSQLTVDIPQGSGSVMIAFVLDSGTSIIRPFAYR